MMNHLAKQYTEGLIPDHAEMKRLRTHHMQTMSEDPDGEDYEEISPLPNAAAPSAAAAEASSAAEAGTAAGAPSAAAAEASSAAEAGTAAEAPSAAAAEASSAAEAGTAAEASSAALARAKSSKKYSKASKPPDAAVGEPKLRPERRKRLSRMDASDDLAAGMPCCEECGGVDGLELASGLTAAVCVSCKDRMQVFQLVKAQASAVAAGDASPESPTFGEQVAFCGHQFSGVELPGDASDTRGVVDLDSGDDVE